MGVLKLIDNGMKNLTCGILIICAIPGAFVKTAIRKITHKTNEATEKIKVTKVDINTLNEETQKWIKRMYNKKNGIPCE